MILEHTEQILSLLLLLFIYNFIDAYSHYLYGLKYKALMDL